MTGGAAAMGRGAATGGAAGALPPGGPGIGCEDRGPVRVITLSRPPTNALDRELLLRLRREVWAAAASPGPRALVIASSVPGAFCSGLDLEWICDPGSPARTARNTVVLARLSRLVQLFAKKNGQRNVGRPSLSPLSIFAFLVPASPQLPGQIPHHRRIDDQYHHPRPGQVLENFIDLQRHQRARRHNRQILRPALPQRQPRRF
ncbi:MAG: hypothetical protein K6T75_02740 [Acetobacteraceae bacterium]|nr:hypothetical protein [Acetobacteraceae bacterium]